jgi:hypothetical protein
MHSLHGFSSSTLTAKLTQAAQYDGVQVNPSDIFSLMGVYPGFPKVPGVPGFDGEAAAVPGLLGHSAACIMLHGTEAASRRAWLG